MAINRKNKRRIVVDGRPYLWTATGDDGWINLRVMADDGGGQQLCCAFDYHQDAVPQPDGSTRLTNQLVVTPYLVRQAIELGLSRGWTPLSGRGELNLGHIDDGIDLRLDQNRAAAFAAQSSDRPSRRRQRMTRTPPIRPRRTSRTP